MQRLEAADPRLRWWAPREPRRDPLGLRCDRFPREAHQLLAGQIGPLANLRSSSGCAVLVQTDSPQLVLHLERLRHHQPVPVAVACEWQDDQGVWQTVTSGDLREVDGSVDVWLPTGLESGTPRVLWCWLPCISTCLVAGISVANGAEIQSADLPEPRWLAIGDSLTQGFNVACPTRSWVHRLMRRWDLPAWNLGVGGIGIEPQVFAPALDERAWDLVTIGLGSNHSWRESTVGTVAERARALAQRASDGPHRRVVWLLPPWKPCEDGKGPPDFFGVPLDYAAGQRAGRVRAILEETLAHFAPRIELVRDAMPHDSYQLPDGLHPAALGMARFADAVDAQLGLLHQD